MDDEEDMRFYFSELMEACPYGEVECTCPLQKLRQELQDQDKKTVFMEQASGEWLRSMIRGHEKCVCMNKIDEDLSKHVKKADEGT